MAGAVKTICVYCGSSSGTNPEFERAANELGAAIASGGHTLVYGGGRVGLMGAVADGALEAGGRVVGVIPESLTSREVAHAGLSELIVTDSMHARKAEMNDRASGFVALPGGFGTLDEALEILTWNQIKVIAKPVAFLDVDGYFEYLFRFFDHAVDSGLLRDSNRLVAQRVDSVREAVEVASGPPFITEPKWGDPSVVP